MPLTIHNLFSTRLFLASLYTAWIVLTGLARVLQVFYGLSYYLSLSALSIIIMSLTIRLTPGILAEKPMYTYLSFIVIPFSYIIGGICSGIGFNTLTLNYPLYSASILYYTTAASNIELFNRVLYRGPLGAQDTNTYVVSALARGIQYFLVLEPLDATPALLARITFWVSWGLLTASIYLMQGLGASLPIAVLQVAMYKLSPVLPLRRNLFITYLPLLASTIIISLLFYLDCSPHRVAARRTRGRRETGVSQVLLFSLTVLLTLLFLQGFRLLVVSSGSMTPTLNVGDIVLVRPVDLEGVSNGDIIAFSNGLNVIIHRVVGVDSSGECLVTRGDANSDNDPLWACRGTIIGKAVFKIPYLGYPILLFIEYMGGVFETLLSITCLLCLTYIVYITKEIDAP